MGRQLKSTDSVPLHGATGAAPHGCLLLIEDSDELRASTAQLFRLIGWNVITAADIRSAVELAEQHPPTVIVTEVNLPGVHGYNFVRALRAAVDHDIKLVALTRLPAQSFGELRAAGFDLVFAKPVEIERIHAQLVPS